MLTTEVACPHCGVLFLRSQSDLDIGTYRFCSEKCDLENANNLASGESKSASHPPQGGEVEIEKL